VRPLLLDPEFFFYLNPFDVRMDFVFFRGSVAPAFRLFNISPSCSDGCASGRLELTIIYVSSSYKYEAGGKRRFGRAFSSHDSSDSRQLPLSKGVLPSPDSEEGSDLRSPILHIELFEKLRIPTTQTILASLLRVLIYSVG